MAFVDAINFRTALIRDALEPLLLHLSAGRPETLGQRSNFLLGLPFLRLTVVLSDRVATTLARICTDAPAQGTWLASCPEGVNPQRLCRMPDDSGILAVTSTGATMVKRHIPLQGM